MARPYCRRGVCPGCQWGNGAGTALKCPLPESSLLWCQKMLLRMLRRMKPESTVDPASFAMKCQAGCIRGSSAQVVVDRTIFLIGREARFTGRQLPSGTGNLDNLFLPSPLAVSYSHFLPAHSTLLCSNPVSSGSLFLEYMSLVAASQQGDTKVWLVFFRVSPMAIAGG